MINLDNKVPEFANKFNRIIEIVESNEKKKEGTKERFDRFYGGDYEIHNHKIDNLKEFYQSK